jgi:phosphatidylglycerol:prolipoprotein diacylglycerol transferase
MLPVLFSVGPLNIFTYGILIALGGALSARFWWLRSARIGIRREEDFWLLVNVILLGGFAGGRLLYLFEYERPFSPEFWSVAASFNRGFSVMGAFVGVIAGVWWFARRIQAGFLHTMDYVCQAAPFWHFFGRLGCLASGCCFGKPTGAPWGVRFTNPNSMVDPELLGRPIHPTQLYEAFGNLAIAALLYRFVLLPTEKGRLKPGTLCGVYFLSYAFLRFVEEFYRGDTVPLPSGLTAAQAFCLALAAGGASLLVFVRYRPGRA